MSQFFEFLDSVRKGNFFAKSSPHSLSFTPEEFAMAVEDDRESKVDKMIDELIRKGSCVMNWVQANLPDQYLGCGKTSDGVSYRSVISQVPAIEDSEPNRHWFGMSFSRDFFMNTLEAATDELMGYTDWKEDGIEPLPGNRSSQNIRQLAILLHELSMYGLTIGDYLEDIGIPSSARHSPFFILMHDLADGIEVLKEAIRADELIQVSFSGYMALRSSPLEGARELMEHIIAPLILRHHISHLHAAHMARIEARVQAFINDLPAVDISTIPEADMKCPFCWAPFEEAPGEDEDNTPVVAPCGSTCPHRFGRDCLADIIKSSLESSSKALCPLCRQEMDIPEFPELHGTLEVDVPYH